MLCIIISVIIHKNNITQTDNHQSTCELFWSCSDDPNQNEAARMIQTKIGAQQDFKHLIQVCLYFHSREPLKKLQSCKDHIATIFNPFMPRGNKKAYTLKQNFLRCNSKHKEVLLTWARHERWCFLWGFL